MELSQLAQRFKSKNATSKQVIKAAESLHGVLEHVSRQANTLDEKLAEYAFFPLFHIFRESQQLPIRVIELALQCLDILISYGWRDKISSELGKQLLILLSRLAGGNSNEGKAEDVNEDLGSAAFQCLTGLFKATGDGGLGENGAIQLANLPVLGHAITVVLDGLNNAPSVRVRLAASNALSAMIDGISDEQALRSFFPGIVSSLTKMVRPGSQLKTSYKLLQTSLQTLEKILNKVISDRASSVSAHESNSEALITAEQNTIDSWAKATAGQVKLALANLIPLQYHERSEVRISLFRLCMSILQNCKNSLQQSISMIAETLIVLYSQSDPEDNFKWSETVRKIMIDDYELMDIFKNSLHGWILTLPRIMQSSDNASKRKGIDRISAAFQLVTDHNVNPDILNDAIALNLRASVSAAIHASPSQKVRPVSAGGLEINTLLQSSAFSRDMLTFRPLLLNETSQKDTLAGLQTLAQQLKVLPTSKKLQRSIIETLRQTSGDEQLASLWLSLQLLNNTQKHDHDELDQYLNLPDNPDEVTNEFLDEAYSFSLDLLSKPAFENPTTWELQALALETLALQASYQKQEFRSELVDALYPILERMASHQNPALQHHAITALAIISHACAYPNPVALIVDNSDYLVNAVALKLNTFESLSPQAPQVLVMMVKLCGAPLVPYLDDVVESVFAVLACYHGYPRLVESLFAVLHAIVEESAKSPVLAITPASELVHRQPIYRPTNIDALAARLKALNIPRKDDDDGFLSSTSTKQPLSTEEDPPPPAPTTLLLKISTLTQHHLTNPSIPLSLSLLSLLTYAFSPLTLYPNLLLPLLATLFPALFSRLHSPLPQICIAAATALCAACRSGGDFLASRFEDCWDELQMLYQQHEKDAIAEGKAFGRGEGAGGMKKRAWVAMRDLLICVVEFVGVRPWMEDGVFAMLGAQLGALGVREVLEGLNADALWLLEERERYRRGEVGARVRMVEGLGLREMEL